MMNKQGCYIASISNTKKLNKQGRNNLFDKGKEMLDVLS